MTGKPDPTDDEVLRHLQVHAAKVRAESYPGDLMADLQPRLPVAARRSVPSTAVLAATAASLLLAMWLAREPDRPARAALTSMPPPPRMPAMPSMSAPVPSMGRAGTLGAGAVTRVRAPAASIPSTARSRRNE